VKISPRSEVFASRHPLKWCGGVRSALYGGRERLKISGAGSAGNYDSTAVLILAITSGSPRWNACQKAVSS